MTIGWADFYGKFGKGVVAIKSILDAARTTVPTEVEDFVQEFDGGTEAVQAAVSGVSAALDAHQASSAGSAETAIAAALRAHMIQAVEDDNQTFSGSLLDAVREFVRQMEDDSQTLDRPTISLTVTPDGGNTGDGTILVSSKDVYGRNLVFMLPETLEGLVTATNRNGSATFRFDSEKLEQNAFSVDFPKGSGLQAIRQSSIALSSGNLIGNGSFATANSSNASLPDGWTAKGMQLGTTINLTAVELQRLAISGTPTAGFYLITYTDANSKKQTTAPIAYNASGAAVEDALQSLTGLGSISVATTGTSPNYTHDITFTGVKKPGAVIAVDTQNVTGGTFTPSIQTAGTTFAVRGARVMHWDPDGSELQTMHYPVSVAALQQYGFSIMCAASPVPVSGVITVDLVDGIDGTTINDAEGTANSFTIDPTTFTSTPAMFTGTFRTPKAITWPKTYLRLRASTVLPSGPNVYFDQIHLRRMSEMYPGGPFVSAFSGRTNWAIGDRVDVLAANDRTGELLDWMDRVYNLRQNRIYAPNAATGSILDSTYLV